MTKLQPNLVAFVPSLGQNIPDPNELGLRYSSIQFNKNTQANLHTDRNNKGLSWIIELGSHWETFGSVKMGHADYYNYYYPHHFKIPKFIGLS